MSESPLGAPPASTRTHGRTPQRQQAQSNQLQPNGKELDDIIRNLESDCQLGLQPRNQLWSPSKNRDVLTDKVLGQIKRCYWTSRPLLERTLAKFRAEVDGLEQEDRLRRLNELFKKDIPPAGSASASRRDNEKALLSERDVNYPRLPDISQAQSEDPDSLYATAPESGSTTEDEGDWGTPPSPTPSGRKLPEHSRNPANASVGPNARKRQSASSTEERKSPKVPKGSKDQSPGRNIPSFQTYAASSTGIHQPVFKKPLIDPTRSHQTVSAVTSFNTSFGSSGTGWSSSPQSQPTTANTSFSSNADGALDNPFVRSVETRKSVTSGHGLLSRAESEVNPARVDAQRGTSSLHVEPEYTEAWIQDSLAQELNNSRDSKIDGYPSPSHLGTKSKGQVPNKHIQAKANASTISWPEKSITNISPRKIPWYIDRLPQQSLFVDPIARDVEEIPYPILFICSRIALDHKIQIEELLEGMSKCHWDNHSSFEAFIRCHPKLARINLQESKRAWAMSEQCFDGFVFKGSLNIRTDRSIQEPLFQLRLSPLQADLSHRFEQKFKSHRFLELKIPTTVPQDAKKYSDVYQKKWTDWVCNEHTFLGRKWRAFYIEREKKKNGSKHAKRSSEHRLVLWAMEGHGIDTPMNVGDMVNWFLPVERNQDQGFPKAFSRIKLGLSRAIPTHTFKPQQIKYVPDILADRLSEDDPFRDTQSDFLWDEQPKERPVMNDGCSTMSVAAARAIWKCYTNRTGAMAPLPSCFQGRIGGAKGMWMIDSEYDSRDTGHDEIWIQISDSQLKFKPHPEDEDDTKSFDERRTTFNLRNFSKPPNPSDLHISYIPILVDRGVPKSAIVDLTIQQLDSERTEFINMLHDPVRLHDWVYKQGSSAADTATAKWQAGLPVSLAQSIQLLLESGFRPTSLPYLAKCLTKFIIQEQLWAERKLRIPLRKSAILYGVADPLGILEPGEIYVRFSTEITDDFANEGFRCLSGLDVLVTRQPAARPSDMQKIRAVDNKELSHLVDVVVFSSRGAFPFAGKLQGGDYDGDTFWLCWEPTLVQPFRNAPAPLNSLPLVTPYYNIKKELRKVREVMRVQDLSTMENFLREALEFNLIPNPLGVSTTFFERQLYVENRMHSITQKVLCDMHDLLMDAAKQGYIFHDEEFWPFINNLLERKLPGPPIHMEAMEACEQARNEGFAKFLHNKQWPFNRDNVTDSLYFEVVRVHHQETLERVAQVLGDVRDDDEALRFPFLQCREGESIQVKHELDRLTKELRSVKFAWGQGWHSQDETKKRQTPDNCYEKYRAIQPENKEHPEIKPWTEKYTLNRFTLWELIKASALYCQFPDELSVLDGLLRPENNSDGKSNASNFVFKMAGRELAYLKGTADPLSRTVCSQIHGNMKPKPLKATQIAEEPSEDDDIFEPALEEQL